MNKILEDLYDKKYVADYEEKPLSRLKRLTKHFNLTEESVVADFACGNAMLLEVIHSSIKEYHGIDFSVEMIDAAKKRAKKLSLEDSFFYNEEIENFSNKNIGKFNCAFALDFSEHVYDDDWLRILSAIKKTLKPNGVLYLHTPNGEYFIEKLKNIGVLAQFPQHVAVRNAFDNIRLLEKAGYEVKIQYLSHYEVRQKPFALLGILPIIGKFFKARIFITATAIKDY